MDTDHLRTFLAVWHSGSFTNASEELGVAPSSVSRAIATLEDELGTRLFQRTTRAMKPTEAGQMLFERANRLIEDWEQTRELLTGDDSTLRGRLRVTCSVAFGEVVIAPMLARFMAAHGELKVDLLVSDQRVNLVQEQIDIGIRHGELDDSSMIARKLATARYKAVASPDFVAQHGMPGRPGDLEEYALLSFSFGEFQKQWVMKSKRSTQTVSVDPALVSGNALMLRTAARSGAGIALLADWMIAEDLEAGTLVEILPEWQVAGSLGESDIWLVYPSRSFIPRKTRAFAEFLETSLSLPR